ncbi:MAG: hypothetical protein ACOCWZ_03485 [Spirochaetota bacterium]
MTEIMRFDSGELTREVVTSMKGEKRIHVIFSTFGEREASLIYEKISLLREELGDLVDTIYLSHRRAGDDEEKTEQMARKADHNVEILICNNMEVPDMGKEKGKGADMRRALYHINITKAGSNLDDHIVIFLDADVVPQYFGAHFVTGLAGAVLKGNDFAKASFWREMGRVKKYVAQPLFSVIDHPGLEKLSQLAYPLSGEVGGTVSFFNSVHFWQIYGVETGINIDASIHDYRVADVNLGLYDHEHHGDTGIQKMSFGIIRTFIRQCVDYGILELKDGATISDIFKASYIDEKAQRQEMEFNLEEKKYQPLGNIL